MECRKGLGELLSLRVREIADKHRPDLTVNVIGVHPTGVGTSLGLGQPMLTDRRAKKRARGPGAVNGADCISLDKSGSTAIVSTRLS